jgi:hypothetical protein
VIAHSAASIDESLGDRSHFRRSRRKIVFEADPFFTARLRWATVCKQPIDIHFLKMPLNHLNALEALKGPFASDVGKRW